MKKTIFDYDFFGKRALVRLDLNVPFSGNKIQSDKRIVESLPTIKYLVEKGAKVIIMSHLGRPNGVDKKFSLKIVRDRLSKLLDKKVAFCPVTVGEKATQLVDKMKNGDILMLENVRFNSGEETCEESFCKELAKLGDIFVFDAFGTAHREHASTYGVAKLLPNAMGFLVSKELSFICDNINTPKRPFLAVIGGSKIGDKIGLLENLIGKVDILVVGGGMSYTFIKTLKGSVGKSLVDDKQLELCYQIVKKALNNKVKFLLPLDAVTTDSFDNPKIIKVVKITGIADDMMGLDIGPKTVRLFCKQIKRARTIFWNGPMGVFENPLFANGTKQIANAIARNKKAITIVGGGDSALAVENYGLESRFSHISTGGGASLKLLEGKSLPCVDVLNDKEE